MKDRDSRILTVGIVYGLGILLLIAYSLRDSEQLPAVFSYPIDAPGPKIEDPNVTFVGRWPNVPGKMMIYRVKWPDVNEAYARAIGERYCGFSSDAKFSREDWSETLGCLRLTSGVANLAVYRNGGSFSLFPLPRVFNYDPNDFPPPEQWQKIATGYLVERGLMPEDAVFERAVPNIERTGEIIVQFRRLIHGYRSCGTGGRIQITIGEGGFVYELSYAWENLEPVKKVCIRSPQEALKSLAASQGSLREKNARIEKISLRYSCPLYGCEYFQPVYYFEGTCPNGDLWGVAAPALPDHRIQSKEDSIEEHKAARARQK